jgi:GntR family mannosyl-D-glycerate transport/metabolism transcriptional repressor
MAENLEVNEGDRIYYVKRVRYLDNNPITVEETWLPIELFPDLTYQVMQGSKYEFIEKQKGMVIDRSEQEIVPILPPQEIADLLMVDAADPIIEKRTRGHLLDNTVFEYSRNYLKSSEYKFTLIAKRHAI